MHSGRSRDSGHVDHRVLIGCMKDQSVSRRENERQVIVGRCIENQSQPQLLACSTREMRTGLPIESVAISVIRVGEHFDLPKKATASFENLASGICCDWFLLSQFALAASIAAPKDQFFEVIS